MKEKLGPSISYLQKLGPEYLDQIFESARWVFEQDHKLAFEVGSTYHPLLSVIAIFMAR